MKTNLNVLLSFLLISAMVFSGCSSMKSSTKGGLVGGGAGAALGAGVGALIGDKKGAAIGAAIGAGVGASAGVLVGKKMDKQRAELEKIEGAQVETVTDANDLQAIKVTFDSGILFAVGKSDLSPISKTALNNFAKSLKDTPETDISVYGHTDNTGARELNERLSVERAQSVMDYLMKNGIEAKRISGTGLAYDDPVADNSTAEGRQLNRRVEVFITANERMIEQAEEGTLE